MNWELPDVRAGFQKGRGPEIKLPTFAGTYRNQGNSRKTSTFASLIAQTVKNLPAMQETWVRSLGQEDPGEGNGNPFQYSCLENPTGREAWQATGHGDCKELHMTEWLTLLLLLCFINYAKAFDCVDHVDHKNLWEIPRREGSFVVLSCQVQNNLLRQPWKTRTQSVQISWEITAHNKAKNPLKPMQNWQRYWN